MIIYGSEKTVEGEKMKAGMTIHYCSDRLTLTETNAVDEKVIEEVGKIGWKLIKGLVDLGKIRTLYFEKEMKIEVVKTMLGYLSPMIYLLLTCPDTVLN
jgi:hypothetical protein